jgi:Tol biopolymer transport system component
MLAGRRAFQRDTAAESMTAILKEDTPEIAVNGSGPSLALQRIVQHCLEKKPGERFQSARDIAFNLQALSGSTVTSGPAVAVTRKGARMWALAAIAIAVALLALAAWMLVPRVPPNESRLMRFTIPAPEKSSFAGSMAFSPDGRKLAFLAISNGRASLWVRSLDLLSPQALPGTEDAASPFWSPDGRWIAFFAQGKLKKIDSSDGLPKTLCDAADSRGGTWNRDGVILFSSSSSDGLYRVSADGGPVARVTKLDSSGNENSHRWPCFLPDGRHFLYLVLSGQPDKQGIFVGSLDSKESKRLLPFVTAVAYAPPGWLIFLSQATLMIQQFDSARLQLKGQPVSVTEQVWNDSNITGLSAFSVSENGMLAYRSGGTQNNQFVWFDRDGKTLGAVGPPGRYVEPCFSADEKRIAFAISNSSAIADLWTMDLAGGNMSHFTFDPSDDATALWSPDGERIVWASNRSGAYDLYQKAAGGGKEELLFKSATSKYPDDWSLDGRFILYESVDPKTQFDLWVLPMSGDQKPMPYLQTEYNETHARFSPDVRWVAYASDESGRSEVYVQSFPATGGKWQISSGGGDQPLWRRDGKELFYVAADGKLMTAEVNQGASTFQSSVPKPLLGLHVPTIGITSIRNYILVTSDGKRFLIVNSIEDAASFPITVILNWTSLLKR